MNQTVKNIGTTVHRDPFAAGKTFVFLLIALLLLMVVYKFMKGFGKATELISDLAPSTEAEKEKIVTNTTYQDNIKWLDDRIGFEAIARKAGFPKVTDYLAKKNFPFEALGKNAQAIWDAKFPFYIDSNAVYNAFAAMPSKAAASLMAWRFNDLFKSKIGFYKFNSFLTKYMKPNELEIITKILAKKPEV